MVFRVFLSLCCYSDYFRSNMYVLCLYVDLYICCEWTCFCSAPIYRCMPYRLTEAFTHSPFVWIFCVASGFCFECVSLPHPPHFFDIFALCFMLFFTCSFQTRIQKTAAFSLPHTLVSSFHRFCSPVSMIFNAEKKKKKKKRTPANGLLMYRKNLFPIRFCRCHICRTIHAALGLLLIFIRLFFYDFCGIFV